MKKVLIPYLLILLVLFASCKRSEIDLTPRDTRAKQFVYISDRHFEIEGKTWFPKMVNYKVDWRCDSLFAYISPAIYYDNPYEWETEHDMIHQQLGVHLEYLEDSLHANAVRFCLDVVNSDEQGYFYGAKESPIYLIKDSSRIFSAIGQLVETLRDYTYDMRAMLLLKAPLDEELMAFTQALLSHFSNEPLIWAYDFMNEPLYFDPAETRDKMEAYGIADSWRKMMNEHAPHQLFTIAFAEPIEVFEWDPAMLPVDFVEMHTYHPLRVASEMYWYGQFCDKPWIVGETSLPADGDSVPYAWQSTFMQESFRCAVENGACGYGWWEFQDCPQGVNFEAQYSGLLNHEGLMEAYPIYGTPKPAARAFKNLDARLYTPTHPCPMNYQNMLGYRNIAVTGKVLEKGTRKPIEGAVVRGWNNDWSVGMNTFTNARGEFTLYSNDYCVHFEISAPGMSHEKFDRLALKYLPTIDEGELAERDLEYQQIDYRHFLVDETSLLTFQASLFSGSLTQTDMGIIYLKELNQ